MITADRARELFSYDPFTGRLYWRVNRRKVRAGEEAGTLTKGRNIYRQVCVDYRVYRVHRVIWLMVNGSWPKGEIDHIDGDGLNNRIENLRDVNRQGNARNMSKFSTTTSGFLGVGWHTKARKWRARLDGKGCPGHLGLFEEKQQAIDARKAAEAKFGFHQNHGRD